MDKNNDALVEKVLNEMMKKKASLLKARISQSRREDYK